VAQEELLASWNDTPTRGSIVDFVQAVTTGPDAVPVEERIATFDTSTTRGTTAI
jgi:hypothetical protein